MSRAFISDPWLWEKPGPAGRPFHPPSRSWGRWVNGVAVVKESRGFTTAGVRGSQGGKIYPRLKCFVEKVRGGNKLGFPLKCVGEMWVFFAPRIFLIIRRESRRRNFLCILTDFRKQMGKKIVVSLKKMMEIIQVKSRHTFFPQIYFHRFNSAPPPNLLYIPARRLVIRGLIRWLVAWGKAPLNRV